MGHLVETKYTGDCSDELLTMLWELGCFVHVAEDGYTVMARADIQRKVNEALKATPVDEDEGDSEGE